MHQIVFDQPYSFVPPRHGRLLPAIVIKFLPRYLRKKFGIVSVKCRGMERLRSSIAAGHAILLTPNHCHPADPFVMHQCSRQVKRQFYTMASWHLFMQNAFQSWLLSRMHVFSVYREGLDTASVKEAISVLKDNKGPLVIFPEGLITRTNDCLAYLIEGTSFIARSAAKQRAKESPSAKVVVHPVAIRYFFDGKIEKVIPPVLDQIEERLTWRKHSKESLLDRIKRIGEAILGLKEIEYIGQAQEGDVYQRITSLINAILVPLEKEWEVKKIAGDVPGRVRALRSALLPDLIEGALSESERERRWEQLANLYFAQQLSLYPPQYIESNPTPEHFLETVQRFEEDLTDQVRVYQPIRVVVEIGEAIEVSTEKGKAGEKDELMEKIGKALKEMLAQLLQEAGPTSGVIK